MKVIYMGTPDFAAGPLEYIYRAGYEITAVVTQPDRPKGRSKTPVMSPVKEVALKYGIPVLTPERIRNEESIRELSAYPADVIVVCAFGQILPPEVLNMTKYGCINIHASLLPHLRGASPIQHSILLGDSKTGVTIMQMDEGLDTGDILIQESIPILDDETGGSLFDKLSVLGSELIVKALPMIEAGELTPIPQDESKADKVGLLKKEMGLMDFSKSSAQLDRHVRGMDPWPGAYTYLDGRQLKIWKAKDIGASDEEAVPGTIIKTDKDHIYVACKNGILRIDELQIEGKKRMSVHDFMLGQKIESGMRLGNRI